MPPRLYTAPDGTAQMLAPVDRLDFFCPQSIDLPHPITPQVAWSIVMSRRSVILSWAFKIRDAISSRFGVQEIGGFTNSDPTNVQVGDMLDFFLVEYTSNDVLSLSSRDSHLDVLTCISTQGTRLTITSSVKTHNWFGKLYMLPVAPAHKLIVWIFLRRIKQACVAPT